jgi:hypothetical protein
MRFLPVLILIGIIIMAYLSSVALKFQEKVYFKADFR